MNPSHKSVLTQEVVHHLSPQKNAVYLDVTFGVGGHTTAILQANSDCRVIALDWDAQALEKYGVSLQEKYGDRLTLIWGNFAHLYKIAKKEKIPKLDGILADFGTSQVQLSSSAGFSFLHDSPLDMRMSPAHQKVTAADVLNSATAQELADIFFMYGEEKNSRRIAREIVAAREQKPFKRTVALAEFIEKLIPRTGKGLHPATKVFQALRIYVNQELANIQAFLPAAVSLLAPEGKLLCISFHSLEDRLVKQFFIEQEQLGVLKVVTKKSVVASAEELAKNPSSRSAKLRVAQKC